MKKHVKKLILARETLRDLDVKQVVGASETIEMDETENTCECPTRLACGVLIGD